MKQFTIARLAPLLLAAASFLAVQASAADWNFSAEAPVQSKAAYHADSLRLSPGTASPRRLALGEADAAEIAEVREANSAPEAKRLQVGIGRDLARETGTSARSLQWLPVAGGMAAHWEVTSGAARALRIELIAAHLPQGTEVRVTSTGEGEPVYGPFTVAEIPVGQGSWWSPVIEGETALVEVFVPAGRSPADLVLSVSRVSHLFVSPADRNFDALAKNGRSGSCEVDLICRSATDAALAQVGKAVAKLIFGDGVNAGSYFCTGTLLNPIGGGFTPYIYTAAHCVSSQASASTLTTHWFYDTTACRSATTSPANVQVTGGAALLYANTSTDASFLRMNQSPPAGAVFAGWDATAVGTGTALTAVHHPSGDWKKVSLGTSGGFSGYGGVTGDSHIIALWNSVATGVVEPGSSGSGIFTAVGQPATDYRLRGGLHGGPSSCTATGVDLRDYYSRLDRAYPYLSQYLNPGSSCTYTISPSSASVGSGAASGSFSVTTSAGCTWIAASNATWLTSASSGTGSGTVQYSVAANSGAARSGTISVGGQVFTVSQQAGSGGTTTNIVSNGGFESGSSSWTQQATGGEAIITTGVASARSGSGYAWLGGYVNGTDSLYQDIPIPAGASPVSLQFWYRISTTETTPFAWDTFEVLIQSPTSGATLARAVTYSNVDATSGWVQSAAFNLEAYAGQTIRLRFTAVNDSSNFTSFLLDDITLSATTAASSPNYTAMWWNPSENGWGLNLNHQGNILYALLYSYASDGADLWLDATMTLQSDGSYSGPMNRYTGPPFSQSPWGAVTPSPVGTMRIAFTGTNTATLTYTYDGITVPKSIQRFEFPGVSAPAPTCTNTTGSRASEANYQDMWWNAGEPGWGVNIVQQGDILFTMIFTYKPSGRDGWLVASNMGRQSDGSYTGTLYSASGPPFNSSPWPSSYLLVEVGTATLRFSSGEAGTLTYTVSGTTVPTKQISRFVFSSPVPVCR